MSLIKFILKPIITNNNLKKVIYNINWLIFENLVQIASSLIVGVWVARYLGPDGYGVVSYAVALITIFTSISDLGLPQIIIKELVEKPTKKTKILGTSLILKAIAGIFSILILITLIMFLKPNNPLIQIAVLIVSLKLLIESPNVINYWFLSKISSKYQTIAKSVGIIVSSILKIFFILLNFGVLWFLFSIIVESIVTILLLNKFYKNKSGASIFKLSFSMPYAKLLLKNSWPLLLTGISASIYKRIDQVIIGSILDTKNLGYYAIAVTIAETPHFLSSAISSSVYPTIINSKKRNENLYLNRLQILYTLVVWLSIGISTIVYIFSDKIIFLLFGNQYMTSSTVLKIYIWSGIFIFLKQAGNRFLLTENFQKELLATTIIGTVINILLNIIFVPIYGITGAAYATLISYFISAFSIVFFKNSRNNVLLYIKAFNLFALTSLFKQYKKQLK